MIRGIVSCVPANVVRNDDEAFIKMTGVKERRIALPGQDVATFGTNAALHLMDKLGLRAADIGALIVVTQTPVARMPATACKIAQRIGFNGAAFDVNLACSGYVYGLWLAGKLDCNVMLIAGDTVSAMTQSEDKLFGDAVTATFIECGLWCINSKFGTDGDGFGYLIADPTIRMNGAEVMNFALKSVPKLVHDTTMNAYCDWYFFHQANRFLLNRIITKSALDDDKCPINIEKYGNTSSASIPLLMCDSAATEGLKDGRNRVAMFGFGAGWSWGGVMLDLEPLQVCEVVSM